MNPQDPSAPIEPQPQVDPQQPVIEPLTQPQVFQQAPTPIQPVMSSYQPQQMPQPQAMPINKDPGHGLGIASLITSILGFGVIGIILGVVAHNKSKKAGYKNTLSIIGIVWGSVVTLLIVPAAILFGLTANNFHGAQAVARDTERKVAINTLYSKLEEYYNQKNSYPLTIDAANFPGIDEKALKDPKGNSYEVSTSSTTAAQANALPTPTDSKEYQYLAFGCDAAGCSGYVLRSYIESPTAYVPNPYVKTGLFNP
jgi:type II secretory pathway pseudopilin PulG